MDSIVKINIGDRFGEWEIIKESLKRYRGNRYWYCKCDCGVEKDVLQYLLINEGSVSCGGHIKRNNKSPNWKGFGEISSGMWNQYICHSKARNLDVEITIQEAWELFLKQNRKCALSGVSLVFALYQKDKTATTASLDRIDSSGHYINGNVQWVHKEVNRMKNNIKQDNFVSWCKKIAEFKK